jgi:hypothetical protein
VNAASNMSQYHPIRWTVLLIQLAQERLYAKKKPLKSKDMRDRHWKALQPRLDAVDQEPWKNWQCQSYAILDRSKMWEPLAATLTHPPHPDLMLVGTTDLKGKIEQILAKTPLPDNLVMNKIKKGIKFSPRDGPPKILRKDNF